MPWLSRALTGAALVAPWLLLKSAPGPQAVRPPASGAAAVAPHPKDDALHIAGSGSHLPTVRALARAYHLRGGRRVEVHPSIGSGGGWQAAADGAVDLGLVTLIEGETPPPSSRDLRVKPYAEVAVAVVVHAGVTQPAIGRHEVAALLFDPSAMWDDGRRVAPVLREEGDSSHRVFAGAIPEFATHEGEDGPRRRVVFSDGALVDAVRSTEGAVGLGVLDRGTPGVRALAIDGVAPSPDTIADGRYSFTKTLAFAYREPLAEPARAFVAFARSPAGRAVIRDAGHFPLEQSSR